MKTEKIKTEKMEVVTRVKSGNATFRILKTNGEVVMESEVFISNLEALKGLLDFLLAFNREEEIIEKENHPKNYTLKIWNNFGDVVYKETFEDQIKRAFHILKIRESCKNIFHENGNVLFAKEIFI
jgi:hypothetical protein